MKLSVYSMAIDTFVPMLNTLAELLGKGAQYARDKKFDPTVLVKARLAPDMFPLVMQVQIACDHAKNATAHLMGEEPPHFEDNEQTIDELKARIAKTIDYLQSTRPSAFEGAEERNIKIPLLKNLVLEMNGFQYLRDWALPHFYFHVVTAYGILRHNGVDISKRDYLSHAVTSIRTREPGGV